MAERFAKATSNIVGKLPYWWKIKKKPQESIGAYFLNIVGMEIDEAEYVLNYALRQIHVLTADIGQADICYRTTLPASLNKDFLITIASVDAIQLEPAKTLDEFFSGFSTESTFTPELLLQNTYYIDWETKIIYTRHTYNIDDNHPEGQVQIAIYSQNGERLANENLKLSLHHVWNFFDEFGLLLSCPRIYGERNASYKERILDVMRFPGSANKYGMINGLARELLLKYKEVWHNGGKDLILRRPYLAEHTIMIDDRLIESYEYEIDSGGRVILLGDPLFEGYKRVVTYAAGIDLRLFWDMSDREFMNELFIPDGDATKRLRYYVQLVKDRVPIEWGQFRWNQGVWDSFDPSNSGTACIPSFCDGSVKGWENYGGE